MIKHEEAIRQRKQMENENQEKVKDTDNIFRSKFCLALEDQAFEEVYNSNYSSRNNIVNIITSIILIFYTIFCFIFFPNCNIAATQFENLSIYFSLEIVICFITLVISMLIYFQKRIFKGQYKFIIENSIMGVNYFLLYTHLIITFVIYEDLELFNKSQVEIYVFLSVFSNLIKILYVVFFIKKFIIIFTTSGILFFSYLIITKYFLLFKTSCPTISQILILVVCNIIIYINEVSEKINLHLLNNAQKISGTNLAYIEGISLDSHRQICENLKSSLVKFDKNAYFSYANNSMKKLVVSLGMINPATFIHENDYEKLTQNTAEKENVQVIYNRLNYFKFFMNNKICNDEDKSEMIGQQVLKSEGDQIYISNFTSAFQTILSNITYVNEELHFSNLKLFEYLQKLKNKNINNLIDQEIQKTSTTQNKYKEKEVSSALSLSDLIKLILNQYTTIEKEQANKINRLRTEKTKLTELNVTNRLDKNTYIKINENSELNISKDFLEKKDGHNTLFFNNMKTNKSGYLNSCNMNNLYTLNNETLNVVLDRLKTKNIESNYEQVFLGIVLIPGSSSSGQNKNQIFPSLSNKFKEDKEYYIHYLILPNREIVFTLEDLSIHIKKERSETSNICRSLYLSKFSHELKNPICNMLEIIEFLNEELIKEENKTELNIENKLMATTTSKIPKNTPNLIFESPSENSSSSDDEISKKNDKYKSINYLPKQKTCDKTCNQGLKFLDFKKTISQNVNLLKSIGDMLILIFKDFNFYSNLLLNEETRPLPALTNNFDRLNSKRKTSRIYTTKLIDKSQNFQKDSPAPNQNFINSITMNNMNFIISNKTCNYKKILTEVIQIFSSKSEIDKKLSKINFEIFFDESIPNSIECDKEKFNSMIFNIFYHLYLITVSGKIVVRVELNNKLQGLQTNNKINFEIFVNGITNFNKNSFIDPDIVQGDINLEKEIFIEEKESILPEKGNLHSAQLLNELERKSDLNNFKEGSNQFVEYLQVNNILNITNPHKRNSIIDNFNKNFQFFISYIYSNELGIRIKYSNDKNKLRIFFQHDIPTNFETNDEAKYSEREILDESKNNIQKISISNSNTVDCQKTEKRLSQFFKVSKETPLVIDSNRESSCSLAKKSLPEITLSFDSQRTEKIPHNRKFYEKATYQNLNKILSINAGEVLEDPVKIISNDTCVINKSNIIINNKYYLDSNAINESIQHKKSFNMKKTNTDKNVVRHNQTKKPTKRLSNIIFFPRSRTKQSSKKSGLRSCTTFHKRGKNIRLSNKIIPRRSIENVCRVILCDDEYLIRKTLNRFLETYSKENTKIKFEIYHAENGYECLSLIYKSHNEGLYYDLLIIDETMPFIKGSQMIFLLKSMIMDNALKNITIVSFTSYDSPDKVEYIYSQGADYVISKPMKYDDFKIFLTDEILTNQRNHSSCDDEEEE